MQSMTPFSRAGRPRPAARGLGLALLAAATVIAGSASVAAADCPWIVQPGVTNGAGSPASYDIVFDGLGEATNVFYGFTVASTDLAWELASNETLPDLAPDARRLESTARASGAVGFSVAADSIEPHTIYLVASRSVVRELEAIDARIEPAHPIAVSQYLPKTRGGSPVSGPMPRRSVAGVEIASDDRDQVERSAPTLASLQICAYQVAVR